MKKKLITALMLSTVVLTAGAPFAAVKADSTDSKIAQQDSKIANAKNEAAKAQSQVDSIQSQVSTLKSKQTSMTKKVNELMAQQKEQSQQIQKLSESIKERNTALEAQARSAQTDGSATNYMSAVLDSKSLTDAIQKMTAMATVAGANKSMIEQQQADQKAIQTKLADNQKKYAEATKLQQELDAQANELATQEAALKVAQLDYQATVTTAEGKKQDLLSQKAAAEKAAQKAAAAEKAAAAKSVVAQQEKAVAAAPAASNPAPAANNTADNSNSSTPSTGNNTGGNGNSSKPTPTPDPTPIPTPDPVGINPYPWGQCTWGVWEYFGGNIPTYAGNAADWATYANSGPAVGTIAVFPPGNQGAGGFGHVAVVTAINGDKLTISETNFSGPNGGGLGIRTTREVSASGVSFIRP
ncbi:CHAP domain-containing protein [Lactococcus petauri]|uniref:CHAP domain-containing protein n=1 Tax=Lactococcus TaxID=1357 RepID=UPI000315E473|nr:CHAP domain-containing protein [Lactococcus petauri]MCG3097113.1 CHAP domain-containing protein [Lactococcus petauri]MDC0811686.1 CHAP domain-containing protein [Lactococcus petauri]PST74892.1 CHAP domain-containing protein [Lactococcus garvieae]RGB59271.1 CHAP domain-containing protein [Lactococcus petauri]